MTNAKSYNANNSLIWGDAEKLRKNICSRFLKMRDAVAAPTVIPGPVVASIPLAVPLSLPIPQDTPRMPHNPPLKLRGPRNPALEGVHKYADTLETFYAPDLHSAMEKVVEELEDCFDDKYV